MAENMTIEALIKIVAYGVPALMIVLGFFGYFAGYSINAVSHDAGMMNTGIVMIILGTVFYVLEFIAKIAAGHNNY
jgi:hypothetical protein